MFTKATILGSGTCVPRLERSACAVLIETGAAKILLDLGPGTMRRMLEYGTTIFDLTHIFLSHFHPDHTAELAPFIFATKYPDNSRRQTQLTLFGGKGLGRFYEGLQSAYGEWIVLPAAQFVLCELGLNSHHPLQFKDFSMTVRPVNHRPESLAVRIEGLDGISVVYSGDTDTCDDLADLAYQADLFICEAALPDALKVPGHLTPGGAARIADRAQVKRLVLTHLYPPCDEVDIVKQARKAYKGPIVVAEDLMSFDFGLTCAP
jgi:ribonuclease BN (tRNA processing enzyme)